jgi:histidine phosphatase superfamily protein (branch 1)
MLWITLAGLVSGCAASQFRSKPGTTTTVILLRHADRDESTELNAKGRERAQALVSALSDIGITAIYSPDVTRNLDTVRPLAAHLGVEITVTPRVSILAAKDIAREILSRHAGGVVVYVGNVTGNLYAVYHQLGGTGTAPAEYGDLAILTVPDRGSVKVERRWYGP